MFKQIVFEKDEIWDISFVSLFLGFLFSLTFQRFNELTINFYVILVLIFISLFYFILKIKTKEFYLVSHIDELVFIIFLAIILAFFDINFYFNDFFTFSLFIFVILFFRQCTMKYFSYYQGFNIIFILRRAITYGFNQREDLSSSQLLPIDTPYYFKILQNLKNKFSSRQTEGFPVFLFSIFLYVISFMFFIYPSIWSYNIKKIPHMFFGTASKMEMDLGHLRNLDVSHLRISRTLLIGSIFFFLSFLFNKLLFYDTKYYMWFFSILAVFAIFHFIPLFGIEPLEDYRQMSFNISYSRFLSICFIFLGLLISLFIEGFLMSIFITFISLIFLTFFIFLRKLV